MRIYLIRHGKPTFWQHHTPWTLVKGSDLKRVIAVYEDSGIAPESQPPPALLQRIHNVPVICASDRRRSVESAHKLGVPGLITPMPIFREADTPAGFWRNVWLPWRVWTLVSRIYWRLGHPAHAESVHHTRQRACQAADVLLNFAQRHGSVALVAHGWINVLIRNDLQRRGWRSQHQFNGQYWGCNEISWIATLSPACAQPSGSQQITG